METKSDTFFKCTSTLFKIIYHLSLIIPNTRSTHMHVDFWTKFQWSSSNKRPYLWSLKGANIQGRHGYTVSPTKVYDGSLPASQYWPIAVLPHMLATFIEPAQPMSKSQNKHLSNITPAKRFNEIICGCSSLEHAVGVQRWGCESHLLPPPCTEFGASFKIHVHIFS